MSAPQRSSLHLTGALWSHEAVQAGRTIKWLVVAYEAGRDHRLAWATGVKTEAGDSARPIGVSGASVAAAEAQRQGAGRECSPPSLDRARLFPVRPNVDRAATHPALVAHDLGPERRDRRVARIARNVDEGLMPARIVKAVRDQTRNALLAHVGERLR